VSALVFLLAMFMITWTIQNIKKSSKSITNGIREVEKGNLDIQLPIYGKDEFGEIAENLNNMTEKIRNLIGQVQTMADEKRDAEITALEAQINPHFLYNTLDSINWLAISHKEYEVSQMLCDLAAILRYSVGNINHQVSIREVGEWLGHYIELQQMRYHHSFTYEGNIDPKIEGVQIHKLLIQPFMENALVHGFDGIERGGILRVDIFPSENGQLVNIIIEDNGKGMKPELVKELNREPETSSKTGGIGMFNVFSRMRMYYGEECSWKISSEENIGTVVTLVLPIREETT
jgi:two-component system sensor histidine kinase YesM